MNCNTTQDGSEMGQDYFTEIISLVQKLLGGKNRPLKELLEMADVLKKKKIPSF